jgi:hypothetical protein
MNTRPKPPAEAKAELMQEVEGLLKRQFFNPYAAIFYLLNFFTSVDLVGIRSELKNKEQRDGIQPKRD